MSLLPMESYPTAYDSPPEPEHPEHETAQQSRKAQVLPENALYIDVRSYGEFMAGHLSGAHCLPLVRLEEQIHLLSPDHEVPLVIYCATGARAELALGLVQRLGYKHAVNGGSALSLAERLHTRLHAGM
ncbi:rhodanese-like domain-containing protein [Roseateles koreensis]|uniref:Rhodanese-like domain-containing protein n=1 Tax=Roseateles koreensis TaxID=2987526 RepID=A0ABT5KP73_9BURK|nr:rhodanese-like domain-containing protein [Roseateles koreensis]MDC8784706.1 rhodanese-like domain-containing protein [Roseateles koreensis]